MNENIGVLLVFGVAAVALLRSKGSADTLRGVNEAGTGKNKYVDMGSMEYALDAKSAEVFRFYWGKDITDEQIVQKVNTFQKKALEVVNFPCIQRFGFAVFRLVEHPVFVKKILPAIDQVSILDIGCCLGADLRGVIAKGGKLENLVGLELETDFIKLGYEFFGDADKPGMKNVFRHGDVLKADPFGGELADLKGRFDYVFTGSVVHLFKIEDQHKLFSFFDGALKPNGVAFGFTTGSDPPKFDDRRDLHNVESLKDLLTKRGYADIAVHQVTRKDWEGRLGAQNRKGPQETDQWKHFLNNRILMLFSFRKAN